MTVPEKRKEVVTLANAVVQSAQQLTLSQKRLVMLAVARLNPRSKVLPEKPLKITAQDFAEAFNIPSSDSYKELKRASDGILARHITRTRPHKYGPIVERYSWLSRADYATGEGWVSIKFNSEIAPYLVDIRNKFTSYQLSQASSLRSLYSWRILEHFQMHSDKGWWQIPLADFHTAMETPQSYQDNFAQTRRWVIETALDELREKDGWSVSWRPIKRGRKVDALRFDFQRIPQPKLL